MPEDAARAAERALASWDLGPCDIELVSHSENIVFKLTAAGGERYAMRLHRPGYNTQGELESELLWTNALRASGVPTPAHLPTRSGAGYACVELQSGAPARQVGVVEWLDGSLLAARTESGDPEAAIDAFEKLGSVTARVHDQASGWSPPSGFVRRAWDADGLVGEEPLWGPFWEVPGLGRDERTLLLEARQKLHQQLGDLGQPADRYGLIHADLHPHNILVDGERLAIIDFDDCGFGWHAYELAVALYDYRHHADYSALRDALIRGYRSIRPLDDALLDWLPTFQLVRSLLLVAWLHARPELKEARHLAAVTKMACGEARSYLDRAAP